MKIVPKQHEVYGSITRWTRWFYNRCETFKPKAKITVSLKKLTKFWRTLEMPLINCQINLILARSANSGVSSTTGETKFRTTDTNCYVPLVTLFTVDDSNLLKQLKWEFNKEEFSRSKRIFYVTIW